jgi:two-component sensor histidine kinase
MGNNYSRIGRKSLYLLLLFFSTLCYALNKKEISQIRQYKNVLISIYNDGKREKKDIIWEKIVSLKNELNNSNDTLAINQDFVELKFAINYSLGVDNSVETHFIKLINRIKTNNVKSQLNFHAFREMIHYYKSIGHHEKLIYLLEFAKKMETLMEPENYFAIASSLYYETLQFDKAIDIYIKDYSIRQEPIQKVSLLNNIGLAYTKKMNKELAIKYFDQALKEINDIINNYKLRAVKVKQNKKLYTTNALFDFKNLIERNKKEINNEKITIDKQLSELLLHSEVFYQKNKAADIESFYKIAYLYSRKEEYNRSNLYLDSIQINSRRSDLYPNLQGKAKKLKIYNNLKLGKIDLALNDLTLDTTSNNTIKKYTAFSNYQQNNFVKERNLIESIHLRNKIIGILISILLISILTYIAYKIWKKKKIEEKKVAYKSKQMTIVKKETELKLKESDHRIMNSLQLVANLASLEKMKNENNFDIQAFQLKMMSIAEIHKLMQENKTNALTTEEYFNEVANLLKNSLGFNGKITLNIVEKEKLDSNTLKNLGLILIELIINSVKHSEAKTKKLNITIEININTLNNWNVDYQDNGLFNYDHFIKKSNYNTSMVALLIQSLRAKYTIMDKPYFNIKIYKK